MDHIDMMEQGRLFRVGAREYGGSFVKSLAEASAKADPDNQRALKKAFPAYWTKYVRLGKQLEGKDVHSE